MTQATQPLGLTEEECRYINRCLVASVQLQSLSAEYISKIRRVLKKKGHYKFKLKKDTDQFLVYLNRMNREIFGNMTQKEQEDMGDDGEELENALNEFFGIKDPTL